jgi:uncharacterized MAPEG superfamily protein
MTIEVTMMITQGWLAVFLALLAANGTASQAGLRWGLSNRDVPFTAKGWVDRAHRTHRNHLENLVVFVAVIGALQAAGVHSTMTQAGAVLFGVARTAYAFVYVTGFNPLAVRTQLFFASIVGLFLMTWGLVA